MSRSDWNILAALAGLAALFVAFGSGLYLASLNDPREQRYQPYRYAAEQPAQVEATTTTKPNAQPLQYRTPCSQPEGQGESDLCAQWRAANAAQDGAFWTKWGVWIGIIGSSLLLWQIILTRQAVEDTGEATEAMREANKIMQTDQRPWLKAHLDFDFVSVASDDGWAVSFKMKIENIGKSPASRVTWMTSLHDDLGKSMRWIDAMISNESAWETEVKIYNTPITILPGETFEDQEMVFINTYEVPSLAMVPTSIRMFLTIDYEFEGGKSGRTMTHFIFGPAKPASVSPGAFDLEKRVEQTNIVIKKMGTVLAR